MSELVVKAKLGQMSLSQNPDVVTDVDLSKFPEKADNPTAGDLVVLNEEGGIEDSGKKPDDFAEKSEMSVSPNGDKTTITLHSELSVEVLREHQSLDDYATGVEYDSAEKKIFLKHGDTRLPGFVDATNFIKDGMVSSALIINVPDDETPAGLSNGDYLKVSFNTDAGKDPIYIRLADIFNPANFYNKTDADERFKQLQTPVSNPVVPSGGGNTSVEFVDSITQNANGEIAPTKKAIPDVAPSASGLGGQKGLMSAADKEKLNGIEAGAQANPPIDSSLSGTSENAVQNKVVKAALDLRVGFSSAGASLAISGKTLSVMGEGGVTLWKQGYDIESKSGSDITVSDISETAYLFKTNASSSVDLTLPTPPTNKVGDFVLNVYNPPLDYSASEDTDDQNAWPSDYDATASYDEGDVCSYNAMIWRCISAISGGESWNSAHWELAHPYFSIPEAPGTVRIVVPAASGISDMLTFAPGARAQLYFTLTPFNIDGKPTWKVVRQDIDVVP